MENHRSCIYISSKKIYIYKHKSISHEMLRSVVVTISSFQFQTIQSSWVRYLSRSICSTAAPTVTSSSTLLSHSNGFRLRNYQEQCIEKCIEALSQNQRRIAVSLATGGGKTVIFSNLINRLNPLHKDQGDKVLIIVHRKELAQQALEACQRANFNKTTALFYKNLDFKSVDTIIATIQTMSRGDNISKLDPKWFKAIIIDEVHHGAASTYRRLMEFLQTASSTTNIAVIGFSATLSRHDGKALTNVVDYVVFHKGLDEMIKEEWLCDAKLYSLDASKEIDLSQVAVSKSDFRVSSLSDSLTRLAATNRIVETYLKFKETENINSTLVFGADIEHVKVLVARFSNFGVSAECVTASTGVKHRAKVLQDFKDGKLPVLINCGVYTEGTNIPNVDCVIIARPTRSLPLFYQMIGRGLRTHNSKETCHIISFITNVKTETIASLFNLPWDTQIYNQPIRELLNRHQEINAEWQSTYPTMDELENKLFSPSSSHDIVKNEPLPWYRVDDHIWQARLNGGYLELCDIEPIKTEIRFHLRNEKNPGHFQRMRWNGSLASILQKSRNYLNKEYPAIYKNSLKNSFWRNQPSTPKQRERLFTKLSPRVVKEYRHHIVSYLKLSPRGECSFMLSLKKENRYFDALVKHFHSLDNILPKSKENVTNGIKITDFCCNSSQL